MSIKITQTGVQFPELVNALPPREFTTAIKQDPQSGGADVLTSVQEFNGHWGFRSMSAVIETPDNADFPDATLKITISGVIDYVEGDDDHRDILFEQTVGTPVNTTEKLIPSAIPDPADAGLFLHGYPTLVITATWVNPVDVTAANADDAPTAKLLMTFYA